MIVAFDSFARFATVCVATEKLERQWIGIDLSPLASMLVNTRLRNTMGLFYSVDHRTDFGKLLSYKTHKQEGEYDGCKIFFPFMNFTIDHIMLISKGGSDHVENLQLLCNARNSLKGSREQMWFKVELKNRGLCNGWC